MRKFPIIGVLKDNVEITDLTHPIFNKNHVNITSCQLALNKRLKINQTCNIYVVEETGKVFCELPDGTTLEFYGEI